MQERPSSSPAAAQREEEIIEKMLGVEPSVEVVQLLVLFGRVGAPQHLERRLRVADDLLANSPRYLEIAKVSSNLWWNASRDNMLQGLGMLVHTPSRASAAGARGRRPS